MERPIACCAVALLAAPFALAGAVPEGRALMMINQALPGTFPPFAATDMASTTLAVNSVGGWSIKATSSATDFIWGAVTGGGPANAQFLALESILPAPGAPSFLPRTALSDAGGVLFSAGTPWSLWTPAGPVAKRPDPLDAPLASALGVSGKFYGQFLSTYQLSQEQPVWRCTWQDTPDTSVSNTNVGYSIIRGRPEASPTVLLATGFTPAGAPAPIGAGTNRGFDTETVGAAKGNANFIVEGFMAATGGVTADTDQIMVVNGAVMMIGGGPVREDSPMLTNPLFGDERWDNFDHADINDAGQTIFVADTISATAGSFNMDEVLVVNGVAVLREQVSQLAFDGGIHTLGATTGEVAINNDGDWAVTWNTTGSAELIIVNGAVVVATGVTPIDTMGLGEPDAVLSDIALRTDAMTLGDRRPDGTAGLFFVGAVGGSFTQGVFVVTLQLGAPSCPADLDGDGTVGASDLASLLGSWGPNTGPADLDGDGAVGASDLASLLGSWGPC